MFQAGLFMDYAYLRQRHRFPDLPKSNELASVGVSLRYSIGRYLDLQCEIGTQLERAPGARERDTRAAIVATPGF